MSRAIFELFYIFSISFFSFIMKHRKHDILEFFETDMPL